VFDLVGSIRGMQLCFILLVEVTDFSESIYFILLSYGKRKNVVESVGTKT
jgi:hypothetical protein